MIFTDHEKSVSPQRHKGPLYKRYANTSGTYTRQVYKEHREEQRFFRRDKRINQIKDSIKILNILLMLSKKELDTEKTIKTSTTEGHGKRRKFKN